MIEGKLPDNLRILFVDSKSAVHSCKDGNRTGVLKDIKIRWNKDKKSRALGIQMLFSLEADWASS